MYIAIVIIIVFSVGFIFGKKYGLKHSRYHFQEAQDKIDGLTVAKNSSLRQLENCRNKSKDRAEVINDLREELYAYYKKYGQLD